MPKFKSKRAVPYKSQNFVVYIDGQPVAGLSKCSALKKTTEMVEWREGGDPSSTHKFPGKTKYEAITLTAGVTHDTVFEAWANLVNNFAGPPEMSLKNFRKDIQIEVRNEAGDKALAYNVFNCWVSEYQALPELDASGNTVAIQTLKIENEGWERDANVPEPEEK